MLSRLSTAAVSIVSRSATKRVASRAVPVSFGNRLRQYSGDTNITYSGGQATEGQGGFYGSGGSRATLTPTSEHRPEMLALAVDVQKVTAVMEEVDRLESLLMREKEDSASAVTGKSIEIKSSIKKLMTSPEFMEALNKLEVMGEPVWGLSSDERELIILAREKVNEC